MATGITDKFRSGRQGRRVAKRLEVLAPVIVQALAQQCCCARSKDISTGEAYLFVESDQLSVDTKVELTLSLPKELTGGAELLMRAFGTIIRVDRLSGDETRRIGVAVVFEKCDFIPLASASC